MGKFCIGLEKRLLCHYLTRRPQSETAANRIPLRRRCVPTYHPGFQWLM